MALLGISPVPAPRSLEHSTNENESGNICKANPSYHEPQVTCRETYTSHEFDFHLDEEYAKRVVWQKHVAGSSL